MKLSFFILSAIIALSYPLHGKCKRKKINLDKLAKEWNDEEEDEAWHEDTHEWKRKMNDKNKKTLNIKDIETMGREDLLAMSQHNNNGGVMAMTFAQLKPGVCTKRECTEKIAIKWTDQLVLGGVQIKPYAVEDDQILLTQEDGNMLQLKDFVLAQPEVEKWTWNSKDYFPDGRKPSDHANGSTDGQNDLQSSRRKKKKRRKRKKKNKAAKEKGNAKKLQHEEI